MHGYAPFAQETEVQPGETAKVEAVLQKQVVAEVSGGEAAPGARGSRGMWGIEWVPLPGGSFDMGSNDGDNDEKPVHQVTVRPFSLMKTEITVAQYRSCVQAGKCTNQGVSGGSCNRGQGGREQHPMNCIDWGQADAFYKAAGGRLATEAEWEYAARSGGRDQKYAWGDEEATCDRAVMGHERACTDGDPCGCGQNRTWPVCSKPAGNSAQGLCDLAGNVWEWTADWFGDYPQGSVSNPTGPSGGSDRVSRGGGWLSPAQRLRSAAPDTVAFRPSAAATSGPTAPGSASPFPCVLLPFVLFRSLSSGRGRQAGAKGAGRGRSVLQRGQKPSKKRGGHDQRRRHESAQRQQTRGRGVQRRGSPLLWSGARAERTPDRPRPAGISQLTAPAR